MKLDFEEYIADIVENTGKAVGAEFLMSSLTPIGKADFKKDVADSPFIFRVDSSDRSFDAILMISNPDFPDFVWNAVVKAQDIAGRLPNPVAEPVLLPFYTGRYGKQSFAFYHRLRPMSAPLLKRIQERWIRRDVYQWLEEVAANSRREIADRADMDRHFVKQLQYVESETHFSARLRKHAEISLRVLQRGDLVPFNVFQHGDFWIGNVLLRDNWMRRVPEHFNFSVIDWLASSNRGYPFIDLLRYGMSTTRSRRTIGHYRDRYAARAGVPKDDLGFYVCAHIGHLGMNRDQFPLERYISHAEHLFAKATATNLHA